MNATLQQKAALSGVIGASIGGFLFFRYGKSLTSKWYVVVAVILVSYVITYRVTEKILTRNAMSPATTAETASA